MEKMAVVLKVNGVYELKVDERQWIVTVTSEDDTKYHVIVTHHNYERVPHNYTGHLIKTGNLIQNGTADRLDTPMEESMKELKKGYSQKKLTKDEIEVDKLIDHVQHKIKLDELWKLIDGALETSNYDVFIELSKEYANLKKKVTV
jgi:ABC-type sugar transport system ATPase subunit